ncbi:hypothetical protein D3C84_1130020 [compost metagenome]
MVPAAPSLAASFAPANLWSTQAPYDLKVSIFSGFIGLLKNTIFPFTLSPKVFNSSIPCTSITSAVNPVFGVATEPPKAQIGTTVFTFPSKINAVSFSPRTQCGTITSCR